jgi:hypothetical protein
MIKSITTTYFAAWAGRCCICRGTLEECQAALDRFTAKSPDHV